MSNDPTSRRPSARRAPTALEFDKKFAYRGMLCGLALFLGAPFFVYFAYEAIGHTEWERLFPDWTSAFMLCVLMIAGMLTVVFSVLFGLLLPSRVTRDDPTVRRAAATTEQAAAADSQTPQVE